MRKIKSARFGLVLAGILALAASGAAQEPEPAVSPQWDPPELAELRVWMQKAPEDALPPFSTVRLDAALESTDSALIDKTANALALQLGREHLLGAAPPSARAGWHVTDTDTSIDLETRLTKALADHDIDGFFASLRPQDPQYAALRAALATETDEARRKVIAINMERWRWMPHSLGRNYVLVNAAAFTARLWRQGQPAGEWRVIVGKRSTPTPVFSATITGVILNPWWEIPASIVREKHGNFPARLGYVRSGDRYRQKPGPGNALGQMKLVMPNRFSVYMHDTPSKYLFERDVRAFSHGCIRVADAFSLAAALLKGVKTREEIDAIVASRETTKINLPASLPVYLTYFTATARDDGTVDILNDIYNRDQRIPAFAMAGSGCSLSQGAASG